MFLSFYGFKVSCGLPSPSIQMLPSEDPPVIIPQSYLQRVRPMLVGGFNPSEKSWSSSNWDDEIPNIWNKSINIH